MLVVCDYIGCVHIMARKYIFEESEDMICQSQLLVDAYQVSTYSSKYKKF